MDPSSAQGVMFTPNNSRQYHPATMEQYHQCETIRFEACAKNDCHVALNVGVQILTM